MKREIYKVFATQVVVSESHPEGMISDINGFPKERDSRSYNATTENPNGDGEVALIVAQADYADEVRDLAIANNPARVAWTVSIVRTSDDKQIARKSWGAFPDMTPQPEPEEQEEEEAQ